MESAVPRTKILFVCNQNKVRSLTAEHMYRVRPDLEVRSAGTASFARTQLSPELLNWAEIIFVFEKDQITAMNQRFPEIVEHKEIICLGLPDKFDYKSQDLVVKLISKLDPYLGRPDAVPKNGRVSVKPKHLECSSNTKTHSKKTFAKSFLSAVGLAKKETE